MARRLVLLCLCVLILAACTVENSGIGGNAIAQATNASFTANNAVATLTAESYVQTAQSQYYAQATNQIIQATVTQQAVEQNIYQSTTNAQLAMVTEAAIQSQSTTNAINAAVAQNNADAAATGTAVAIELLATAQKEMSDIEMDNLRIQNQRELSQIKTREWLTAAVILSFVLILLAVITRIAVVTWRNINPVVIGSNPAFYGPDRQWQTVRITAPAREEVPLLPAGNENGQTSAPETIQLPAHLPKDKIGLGITKGNSGLWYGQSKLGDILGAGVKGSGKSNVVRSIAYQAYKHGWSIYLADAEHLTFDPAVWGNVAAGVGEVEGMLNNLISEFDRRMILYSEAFSFVRQLPASQQYFVEDLDNYNKAARRFNLEELRPILLAWDEANNSLGHSNSLDEALHEVLRRNRKPGCTVAIFGHTFHASQVKSAIFTNLTRRIAFRCQERTSRVILGNPSAADIPNQPGLAIMHENGRPVKVQSYYLPANRLLQDINPIEGEWEAVEGNGEKKDRLEPGDRERIMEMYDRGNSYNAITREIFGYEGGQAFYLVKEVLQDRLIDF